MAGGRAAWGEREGGGPAFPLFRPPSPHPPPPFPQELGIQILADLQRQRETIVHSRDALAGIDENVSRSRQILASMSRRILQNKLLMWGVVALLVFAVLLVAWAKH